ncbi:Malignant T-cell-amplified sequence 1, partial [Galemys pyrenaicus]
FDGKENVSNCIQLKTSVIKGIKNQLIEQFPDPFILPHQQVGKGAIKFVLSAANIMYLGLTSHRVKLHPAAVHTIVAIMAEGKQHALYIRVMEMSAEDIEKVNKGIGIENIHHLNDGLWHMKTYK